MGRTAETVILPSFAFNMVQKSSLKRLDDMSRLGGIFRPAISIDPTGGNSKAGNLLNQSALKIYILDDIAPSESEVHHGYRSA